MALPHITQTEFTREASTNGEVRPVLVTDDLTAEFTFSLGDHVLVDPVSSRGEVVGLQEVDGVTMEGDIVPSNVKIYEMRVSDPYVKADPVAQGLMDEYVDRMESAVTRYGYDPLTARGTEHPYMGVESSDGTGNLFTDLWLEGNSALAAWRTWVPHAVALDYLTNPTQDGTVTPKGRDAVPVPKNPEFVAHMRHNADAIAIRSRSVAMQAIAQAHLEGVDADSVNWLSLASGTAEPSLHALKHIMDSRGPDFSASLDAVDIMKSSLAHVRENAERIGYQGALNERRGNIIASDFPEWLLKDVGDSRTRWSIVEDTGFEEYLPQKGDPIGAFNGMGLPQASDFKERAWQLVDKERGAMISGNMVHPRPQAKNVFGIVDWDLINAREERGILDIHKKAGVMDHPDSLVRMYRVIEDGTGQHVYNITKSIVK